MPNKNSNSGLLHNTRIRLVFLLIVVTAIGTAGYCYIEGWSFFDALYMTVITLTTTGFSEVRALSQAGRLFTIMLLIGGVSTIAVTSTSLLNEVLTGFKFRRKRKMEKLVKKLQNHTIVLGFGRMGQSVCLELQRAKHSFVVVERNEGKIALLEELNYYYIQGNGADDEILIEAGVKDARNLVSVIDDEADCLFSAVAARSLNAKLHIVVRANSESSRKKMLLVGVDDVVLPLFISGKKVAQRIIQPNMEDFLEVSGLAGASQQLQVIDIVINSNSSLKGKTLQTCDLRREGLMILGIKRHGEFIFAPSSSMPFDKGDVLIAIGTADSYEQIRRDLNLQ